MAAAGGGRLCLLAVLACSMLGGTRAEQFHPNKSHTFVNKEQLFKVEYLDDASLTGFVAEDIVQLGDYSVSTRFGCVTKSKGHDWAEADGILGMGFPAAALRSVPFPLFWALTDTTKANEPQSNILKDRIFTLMLSKDRGEIVLGGHDPASVEGAMVTTPVRPSPLADGEEAFMHYMIDVQSLKVGDHELLNFKDSSIAIQAILDSGTSCLVVPDDTFEGGLLESPFKAFQKQFGNLDEPTIYITIEGTTFSIPYDDYMVDDKPCVMKMKNTPRTFLLGDVFFRRMVVVHDLRNPLQPLITVGQRKDDYELTKKLAVVGDRSHVPLGKKKVAKLAPTSEHAVTKLPTKSGALFGGQRKA